MYIYSPASRQLRGGHRDGLRPWRLLRRPQLGRGEMGSALMGPLQLLCLFDRGTFRVLPLTYFDLPMHAVCAA